MPQHHPFHIYLDNAIYFVSARIYKSQPVLKTPNRRTEFLRKIARELIIYDFKIFGWTINLNHYHLLFKTRFGHDLPVFFHQLHGSSAFEWNREDRTPGRKIWQNYFDTCIRDKRHFFIHLNYIHHNAIKHGYVKGMGDYEWSSYNKYLKKYNQEWLNDCFSRYPIVDFTPEGIE